MNFAVSIVSGIISGVLIPIAILAMLIFIGVWTYRDANAKGLNAVLWTLVVVIVPSFIGLIVYLCVRADSKKTTCSKCLKVVNSNTKFCSNCGEELVPVVENGVGDETFISSQKKLLIGFFVSFGINIIACILTAAFTVIGLVQATDKALSIAKDISGNISVESLESLDQILGEQGLRVRVDGDEVFIKDTDGKNVVHVSGDGELVDVDLDAIQKLLKNYGINIEGSLNDDEVEDLYKNLLESVQDNEDAKKQIEEIFEKYNENGKKTATTSVTTEENTSTESK